MMETQSEHHDDLTFGLPLFVEHHEVQGVVEVLRYLCHVLTCQTVGAVDRLVLQVSPVDAILHRRTVETIFIDNTSLRDDPWVG